MKVLHLNRYSIAAVLFLIAAAVLVAISLITNLGEFVTAAFVISGMVCGMMGIFMLTFFSGEPIDPRLCRTPSCSGVYKSLPHRA